MCTFVYPMYMYTCFNTCRTVYTCGNNLLSLFSSHELAMQLQQEEDQRLAASQQRQALTSRQPARQQQPQTGQQRTPVATPSADNKQDKKSDVRFFYIYGLCYSVWCLSLHNYGRWSTCILTIYTHFSHCSQGKKCIQSFVQVPVMYLVTLNLYEIQLYLCLSGWPSVTTGF